MKVALDRPGKFSRSEQSRSDVPPKYASARLFFARLASEIFLTSPQTAFFNNLLGKHILYWRRFQISFDFGDSLDTFNDADDLLLQGRLGEYPRNPNHPLFCLNMDA